MSGANEHKAKLCAVHANLSGSFRKEFGHCQGIHQHTVQGPLRHIASLKHCPFLIAFDSVFNTTALTTNPNQRQ
jgi:hypothetical protein